MEKEDGKTKGGIRHLKGSSGWSEGKSNIIREGMFWGGGEAEAFVGSRAGGSRMVRGVRGPSSQR